MQKLTYFSLLVLIFLVSQGSVAKSQDNGRSTCLLQDPQNQCGDFCLSKIHPMIELVPETNSKLERIHREQRAIQTKLQTVQFMVEAQRSTMQTSLKDITTKEEFGARMNETEKKLMTLNADLKNQLHYLQTNLEDQQKPLPESRQSIFTKDDLEVRLKAMEDLLLVSNSELKEMHTAIRDQDMSMQTKMDEQLLAIQEKMEDQAISKKHFEARLNGLQEKLMAINSDIKNQLQLLLTKMADQQTSMQTQMEAQLLEVRKNTALSESFEKRLNVTEGQLRMIETKMEAQLKELQNRNEIQLLELKNEQSASQKTLSTIHTKIIPPKFELIGSRYFYIEHNIEKTWDEAASTCRGMGGYLAAFKTKEEVAAVTQKLIKSSWGWYWTGIKKEDGKFISTASGKPATGLKWAKGEPNNSGACVILDNKGMIDYSCSNKWYFICQSDNET